MAKSLRSKIKRKHRTAARAKTFEETERKRIEEMHARIIAAAKEHLKEVDAEGNVVPMEMSKLKVAGAGDAIEREGGASGATELGKLAVTQKDDNPIAARKDELRLKARRAIERKEKKRSNKKLKNRATFFKSSKKRSTKPSRR